VAHRQQDLHQQAKPLTTAASLSWPLSILSAFLTGIVGMLAAGVIAAACVDWYSVSSREGASGYFVIALAFLGLVTGFLIGIVSARMVAAGAGPGFFKALLRSVGVVAGLAVLGGGTARLLADVPPELDGETLMLAVEVRWPEDQAASPATGGDGTLTLHSVPFYSNTVRASESGPLWTRDAQRAEGRWVARGAVSIFTGRGKRLLVVAPSDSDTASEGFLVPLPARPGRRSLEWSEWLPRTRPGVSPHNRLTYRFRAQPVSRPARTERIGAWEVDTRTSGFYDEQVNGRTVHAANATFGLRHGAQAVSVRGDSSGSVDNMALLAGGQPAFLLHLTGVADDGRIYLVSAEGNEVRTTEVAEGYSGMRGQPLTADTARFRAVRGRDVAHGQVDRVTYDLPGLYLIGRSVIDTRRLLVHHFTPDTSATGIPSVPPLSLSPDERSFVSFANAGYPSEEHVLVVTNFVDNRTYILPVDEARMRYPDFEALDPAWIAHHFEWKRGADGADRLVERARFTPLPYHGEVTTEPNGDRSYRIEKASDSLRTVLVAFLVAKFQGQPEPVDSGAYEQPVKIGNHVVNVAHSSGFGYVLVSLKDRGTDSTLVPEIASQFDAVLATGRYDSMFGK
jgi:hypothetical protein